MGSYEYETNINLPEFDGRYKDTGLTADYIEEIGDELSTAIRFDDDGNIVVDVTEIDQRCVDILYRFTVDFLETISRMFRSHEDANELPYVYFENMKNEPISRKIDNIDNIGIDDVDNTHVGDVVTMQVQVSHLDSVKDTQLNVPFMCQKNHITFRNFDRAEEISNPPTCDYREEDEDGNVNECKCTPHRKMSEKDLYQADKSKSTVNKMIEVTTQELILSDADEADYNSNTIGAEIDKPLIGEIENRDKINVLAHIQSKSSDDERSTSYYIHILGYEKVQNDELEEEDIEELETLNEELDDPIDDLSECIAQKDGIVDQGDGQVDRAKKCVLISCVKGNSLMDNKNIHTLLFGKSGSGKSKTAEGALRTSDKSEFIDMQKASKAGITGANIDSDELGYIVQAGTITQADGGVCVVDELDKVERKSKQEVFAEPMQRSVINIDKTGHGELPASTSIIATANPEDDEYHGEKYIDSCPVVDHIIDRFDLITRVDPYDTSGFNSNLDDRKDSIVESLQNQINDDTDYDIKTETIAKYVKYARTHNPGLKEESIEKIAESQVKIEKEIGFGSERLKESLVNISTAIAKLKFKDQVDVDDVKRATKIYIDCWDSVI